VSDTICEINLELHAEHSNSFLRGICIESSQQFRQNVAALALQWLPPDIVPHYTNNIAAVEACIQYNLD
jgi:hypothetical protein